MDRRSAPWMPLKRWTLDLNLTHQLSLSPPYSSVPTTVSSRIHEPVPPSLYSKLHTMQSQRYPFQWTQTDIYSYTHLYWNVRKLLNIVCTGPSHCGIRRSGWVHSRLNLEVFWRCNRTNVGINSFYGSMSTEQRRIDIIFETIVTGYSLLVPFTEHHR